MLLGIETATGSTGVALFDDGRTLAGFEVRGERRHAEVLAPAITRLLELASASLDDVDAIALDVGPGLFTGLRVGVATAQGLAQGLGVGVLEATSLSVLAAQAYDAGWQGVVVSVVDARRGEVFVARYEAETVETVAPRRCSPEELAEQLRELAAASPVQVLLVGTGARRYADLLVPAASPGPGPAIAPDICEPSPRALVALCARRLASDVSTPVPPRDVRPVYLRDADARIGWVKR